MQTFGTGMAISFTMAEKGTCNTEKCPIRIAWSVPVSIELPVMLISWFCSRGIELQFCVLGDIIENWSQWSNNMDLTLFVSRAIACQTVYFCCWKELFGRRLHLLEHRSLFLNFIAATVKRQRHNDQTIIWAAWTVQFYETLTQLIVCTTETLTKIRRDTKLSNDRGGAGYLRE